MHVGVYDVDAVFIDECRVRAFPLDYVDTMSIDTLRCVKRVGGWMGDLRL